MKKNIMIINADHGAAQVVKDSLTCPSTNILCVSSMHEALPSFMDKEFCLVILDACISAEDDHKLLKAMRKVRTMPVLILSSQSCHVEQLKALQAVRADYAKAAAEVDMLKGEVIKSLRGESSFP